mgnify:FL=1
MTSLCIEQLGRNKWKYQAIHRNSFHDASVLQSAVFSNRFASHPVTTATPTGTVWTLETVSTSIVMATRLLLRTPCNILMMNLWVTLRNANSRNSILSFRFNNNLLFRFYAVKPDKEKLQWLLFSFQFLSLRDEALLNILGSLRVFRKN